ncbi:MAG TPA: hypothetical protein VM240_11490 [Verrucomicrobiae bacterium]|nr:hypothetical protein [Verrucomicrobiae bacterium]
MKCNNALTLARVALLAVCAGAATAAVAEEPIDDPVKVPVVGVATESQVGRAVRAALTRRGWATRNEKAGYVEGVLSKPEQFTVRIGITYGAGTIVVRYLESDGLDYDAQTREIHRAYNKWMRMLAKEINVNLALFAGAEPGERADPPEIVIVPQVVPVEGTAPPALPPHAQGKTLRAGVELRPQARLAAPVNGTIATATVVDPKGPVRNADGTWFYVTTPTGSGWVRQSDLQ